MADPLLTTKPFFMEATTTTSISVLLKQYDLQTRLYKNVLNDVEEPKSNQRVSETMNHIKWVAGHLLSARMNLLKIAGREPDEHYDQLFGHGNGIDPNADYPVIEEILEKWDSTSILVRTVLAQLPEEALDGEMTQTPIGDSSLRGFLAFMMHHEAYHIGQLGILRKYIGLDAMIYS